MLLPLASTQATLRVAPPLWQADQGPVCHMTAAHGAAAAQLRDAAGAAAAAQPPAHCAESAATAWPLLMHWTLRVAVPVPHAAEQVLHSPASQWQLPHLLSHDQEIMSHIMNNTPYFNHKMQHVFLNTLSALREPMANSLSRIECEFWIVDILRQQGGAGVHGWVLQGWVRLCRAPASSWHLDISTGSPRMASTQERERCAWPPPQVTEHSPKGPMRSSYMEPEPPCMPLIYISREFHFNGDKSAPRCHTRGPLTRAKSHLGRNLCSCGSVAILWCQAVLA